MKNHTAFIAFHRGIESRHYDSGIELPIISKPFAYRVAEMISALPDATEAESANARFICD